MKYGNCCDCYYSGYETTIQGTFCVCKYNRMIFHSDEASIIWEPNYDSCLKFLSKCEGEQNEFSRKNRYNNKQLLFM